MLPIYEAIEIVEVIDEKVGHTKPWVVNAMTPQGLASFVVKLYPTYQVDNQCIITKEVVSNVLSSQFNLCSPSCALIDIPIDLTYNMPIDDQIQFEQTDGRLKFATLKLENVSNSVPELDKTVYKKRIEIDTLYAYDNLIRNIDRRRSKPNLLLGSESAYLIDHEYCFDQEFISNLDIDQLVIADKFSKHHLFYSFLKRSTKRSKENFFEEFLFCLQTLNLNALSPYFQVIQNEGFNDYSQQILPWLSEVRQKSSIFVNYLRRTIE